MNYRRIFLIRMSAICLLSVFIPLHAQTNVITYDVGSFAVTLLSEGQQSGKKEILIGATGEMLDKTIPNGTFPNATNAFLVETGSKTVLFDTGFGRHLFDNLEKLGKGCNDIDAVIITHMHGDHINGLLRDNGKSFPLSELFIPQPEYDYWMSDEEMLKIPENRRGSFMNARKVIDLYMDKLHLFVPGGIGEAKELFRGISSIAAYGHTPGHTGYLLESDDSKMFIWGDLAHAMQIQMPFPEVAVTYDVDPKKAVESRLQLLEYLSDNKIRVAGMHIEYPGICDIRKDKEYGYNFVLVSESDGR